MQLHVSHYLRLIKGIMMEGNYEKGKKHSRRKN